LPLPIIITPPFSTYTLCQKNKKEERKFVTIVLKKIILERIIYILENLFLKVYFENHILNHIVYVLESYIVEILF